MIKNITRTGEARKFHHFFIRTIKGGAESFLDLNQFVLSRPNSGLGAIIYAQFIKNVHDMAFYGIVAELQDLSNLIVCKPFGYKNAHTSSAWLFCGLPPRQMPYRFGIRTHRSWSSAENAIFPGHEGGLIS